MDFHHGSRQDGRGTLSLGAAMMGVAAFLVALELVALTHAHHVPRTEALKNCFGVLLLLSFAAEAVAVVAGLPAPRTRRGRLGLSIGAWLLAGVIFAWVKSAFGL